MPSETAQRTITAIAFAVPAAAALILGPPFLSIFVGAIVAVMAWEWLRVAGSSIASLVGAAFAGLLVLAVAAAGYERFFWALIVVVAGAGIVFALAQAEARAAALPIAVGVLYIGLPALALLWLYAREAVGREIVIWIIAVVVACDVGAYFVGRALKGPKLAPRISPGKTWSGAAGGLAAALVAGLALGLLLGLAAAPVLILAALVVALVAQTGDLFESGLKRAFGVKDASGILPGHGGMMDRVDGIVAALMAAALVIWIGGGDPRQWL